MYWYQYKARAEDVREEVAQKHKRATVDFSY